MKLRFLKVQNFKFNIFKSSLGYFCCVLFVLFSRSVKSQENIKINPILKCLAEEEKQIFESKLKGPIYFLNQEVLSIWTITPNLEIKDQYIVEICKNSNFSPSLSLIQYILLENKSLFKISSNEYGTQKDINISNVIYKAPLLLNKYLGRLTLNLDNPMCLSEELKSFNEQINQMVYFKLNEFDQLITKQDIRIVFDKLKNLDKIQLKCEKKKRRSISNN